MKKALITGVNGQDGSYLAEILLDKGYQVFGIVRRNSTFNRWRIEHLHSYLKNSQNSFNLIYGDMTDSSSLIHIMQQIMPDEIYNLAAQSHVAISFEAPEYTANADALGVLRMVEGMRILGLDKTAKFYQASTSELYGKVEDEIQSEKTPFYPRSPYGVAKLYAYWIVKNYREAYGLYGVNGILFNHESPRRGENFVTKKITQSLANIKLGMQDKLKVGNLEAKRDWGYAREYMHAAWLMMQQDKAEDFVIATGETHSVREFIEEACKNLDIQLDWQGTGEDEKGVDSKTGKVIVEVDKKYLRPSEVYHLCGDATKAQQALGWQPKVKFKELVKLMIDYDFKKAQHQKEFQVDNLID